MLGGETLKIAYASQPPTVVLMAGLQGSGKPPAQQNLHRGLKSKVATHCWLVLTCNDQQQLNS